MKMRVTPKLFVFAAILLTAFYIKAPDNQEMFLSAGAEHVFPNLGLEKNEKAETPPLHTHGLGGELQTVPTQNLVTTISPVITERVIPSVSNKNETSIIKTTDSEEAGSLKNVIENNNQAISLACPANMVVNTANPAGTVVNYDLPVVSGSCGQCTLPTTLPGFTYIGELNGHKYFRSSATKRWTAARDEAISLGGHLVTVTSEAENNFLSGAQSWIGLTDEAVEGTFTWVTGEPFVYNNWWPGQPDNGGAGGNEDYVFTNFYGTTKWVDYGTNYFLPFIVEFECGAPPAPTQTAGLPSGSVFPVGVTTNSFTYTDACQNTATCSFTVTVVLNQATSIFCPQNVQVNATSGSGATVNYSLPTVTDNCQQCAGPTSLSGFTYLGEFGGHRYFRSNSPAVWQTAKNTAISLGAHLVTITSEAENNFVSGNGNPAWIGLTDEAEEGTFVWVTGETFAYSNWWPGNPNNTGGNENHVYMNFYGSTKWVDHNEAEPVPFIIEFECSANPMPTQTGGLPSGSVFPIGVTTNSFSYTDACQNTVTCSFTVSVNSNLPTSITCPQNIQVNATSGSGATVNYNLPVVSSSCQQCTMPTSLPGFTYLGEFGGHRYFRSTTNATWQQAKANAISLGGHLATITSAAENNFLSGSQAWIGLTDEAIEGTFVWVTGEPLIYTNWWPGNPNNTGGVEHHVLTNFYGSTQWVDHNGTEPNPFILEFECTPIPTQTGGLPSGSVFPVGVTTNSFTYTDGCQTTVNCSFTVTVINNQVTTLNCPQNIEVNSNGGSGAIVNYSQPTISSTCPQCNIPTSLPGYTYIGELNNHKYYRSTFSRSWTAARNEAISLGGHLVTITSEVENNFLAGQPAWIGLTDELVEGAFKWVTGETFAYSNWWPGQPNGGTAENYVYMNFYGSTKWVDFTGSHLSQFIVEFECGAAPTPTQTGGLASGSFFPVGVTTNSFTYTDACQNTATCSFTVTVINSQGSTIACPQNIETNASSSSGATVNYNMPVVTNGCQQCAGPTSLAGFTYLGELNGHRYFRSNSSSGWQAAKNTALSLGAHLVTITSSAENNLVTGNGNPAWIGLTDEAVEGTFVWVTGETLGYTNWWPGNPNNTGGIEHHVYMNFYGSTKWVDHDGNEPYPFIIEFECSANPVPNQTAGLPSGSVFPIGVTTNSFSYTDACQNTVTCSFTVTVLSNLPTTLTCPQNITVNATSGTGAMVNYNLPVVSSSCQCTLPTSVPGFTYLGAFGGHQYFRSNYNKTWQQAKDSAISLGAHLVTISSEAENTFVSGDGNPAWIGLTDELSEGNFTWVTGEPLVYTNWWPGNPNGGTAENHVFMNFYGSTKWVDNIGSSPHPFIIEFECTTTPIQTAGLPSGSVFPIGVTTNSFTYTDGCQSTVTCSFTVTVVNNLPLTLTCPPNIEVTSTSASGATVNYNPPVIATSCQQCSQLGSLPGYTYIGEFGGNKYYRSTFTRRWTDAKNDAISLGAHLVTITSAAENNFLAGNQAWIGLTDEVEEGNFKWVTGEPFVYNNWWPGQPNGGTAENYVFTNFYGTTKWVDYGTNYFLEFIIEFECTAVPTPTQTAGLPSGSVFPIGVTTNSFTYTNPCQNTATCSFTVTVINNQATSITCPQNIEVNATSGSGATVNYSLPAVNNGCQQCAGPTSLPNYTYLGEFNGHRYFRSNFESNWQTAKNNALSLGAHLVTISSSTENNFLSGDQAWIGLTDEAVEGSFVWVTGEPLSYTNWHSNNPNGGTAENHVSMNFFGTTQWVDSDGATLHPFIIEFECSANPVPAQTAGLPSGAVFPIGVTTNSFSYTDACQTTVTCSFTVTVVNNQVTTITCPQNITATATSGSGATVNYNLPAVTTSCATCSAPASLPGFTYLGSFGGNKYFRSNFSKTWQQAKDSAISLGAHLVTIASEAENTFVSGDGNPAWIGLTDEVSEGNFVWVTGQPLVYTNWWPGNPNGGTVENHVFMNFYGSTKWVDNIGSSPHPFIIEFECAPVPTQTAGLASGSVFPIGVTTNAFTYTDACQNTVTCSFTVTVNANYAKTDYSIFTKVEAEQAKKETLISKSEPAKELMQVRAYPNPSAGNFNLQVISDNDAPIWIRILDLTGTVKKSMRLNNKIKTLNVGADLQAGVYMAEITQNNVKQMIKLVKLN